LACERLKKRLTPETHTQNRDQTSTLPPKKSIMRSSKTSGKRTVSAWFLPIICILCVPIIYYGIRPLPFPVRTQLYNGVVYYRKVRIIPRLLIAHIITIDLTTPGLKFLVTPGDPGLKLPLSARTTSEFLQEFEVNVAINGDGFTPWHSIGFFDYYPHPGNGVIPNGTAISQGITYHEDKDHPTLYMTINNNVSFSPPAEESAFNAISGERMLVKYGSSLSGLDNEIPAPRTVIGIDGSRRKLILVVVDGRQFLYSQGATLAEIAEILIDYGAESAMSLDGGGSSTMVVKSGSGLKVLNSPIDRNIPGFQRAVGNHLGIFVP
jgi:hypothetical protein